MDTYIMHLILHCVYVDSAINGLQRVKAFNHSSLVHHGHYLNKHLVDVISTAKDFQKNKITRFNVNHDDILNVTFRDIFFQLTQVNIIFYRREKIVNYSVS